MQNNKLSQYTWSKRNFDPNSKEDLLEYKYFLENRKWQDRCPFLVEWPFLSVQHMITTKIIDEHFNKIIESMEKNEILDTVE